MQQFVQQSLMISSLVQLTLAVFCGLRRRHRRLSRLYSYYSLGLFGISLCSLLYETLGTKLYLTVLALSLPLTSLIFYHFVSAFVSELGRQRRFVLATLYLALGLLAALALREMLTGLLLWATVTLLGVPPAVYAMERLLVRARASFSRLEKRQLTYLIASFGVLLLGGLTDLVLASWQGGSLVEFGAIGLLGLSLGTAVSIIRYKFLDLPAQLGRGIAILVAAYLLWSMYSEVVGLIESSFGEILEPRAVSIFQLAMATGVILLLFDPLRKIVVEQMNRVLTRTSYTFQRELTSLSSSLVSVLELSELFEKVQQALSSSPRVAHAEIFLARAENEDFRLLSASSDEDFRRLDRDSALVQLLAQEHRVLVLDEMERSVQLFYPSEHQKLVDAAARQLRELEGEIIVPMGFQKKLSGMIVLAAKETGPFTPREREVLLSLAGQLAITVENARIYDQMRKHDRLVAVGEMATGLAHEIRNPLASIKAAAQYIEPGMVGSDDREFLSILIEEVDRLNNVVSRFLDYARPLQTRLSTHNLNQIVQRVVTLMAPEAATRQVELGATLDPGLPELYIDGEQLRQVLLNLLLNAIEAMDESGGTVRVTTHYLPASDGAGLGTALVQIEDSGRGIPEAEIDKIFNPFYTTKGSGTGLGLAIAYRIIQAHDGSINVQSEVGLGTTFEIRIPVMVDPESTLVPAPAGAATSHES
jgi:two-component system, NtrC family, sensor histidine kinase HydH